MFFKTKYISLTFAVLFVSKLIQYLCWKTTTKSTVCLALHNLKSDFLDWSLLFLHLRLFMVFFCLRTTPVRPLPQVWLKQTKLAAWPLFIVCYLLQEMTACMECFWQERWVMTIYLSDLHLSLDWCALVPTSLPLVPGSPQPHASLGSEGASPNLITVCSRLVPVRGVGTMVMTQCTVSGSVTVVQCVCRIWLVWSACLACSHHPPQWHGDHHADRRTQRVMWHTRYSQ